MTDATGVSLGIEWAAEGHREASDGPMIIDVRDVMDLAAERSLLHPALRWSSPVIRSPQDRRFPVQLVVRR
jgi:hypothetical protein